MVSEFLACVSGRITHCSKPPFSEGRPSHGSPVVEILGRCKLMTKWFIAIDYQEMIEHLEVFGHTSRFAVSVGHD